jgi:hypothetical protein
MTPLILYLLKVNGVLLLFTIAYFLVLRNLTFYKVNRFYLLCGLLFSSVYPFIDLTAVFYSQKSIDTNWIQYVPATNLHELANPGFVWNMLLWVFYAGMMVMSVRFILQLLSLRKIHSRSVQSPDLGKKVRVLNEKIYPFTFWQTIYLNPALHEDADLKVIMEHEKIHVKQWHTVDILLSQLSGIFYWFNPGIWFMKIFIKENLEFLTDEAVIKKGIEKKVYQYNVLKVEAGISSMALANGFNLSGIKRRIRMMNTRQSSKSRLAIYFVVLPVLILFSLAFTISKVQHEPVEKMTNQSADLIEMQVAKAPMSNEQDAVVPPAKISPPTIKRQAKNKPLTNIPKVQKVSGIEAQPISNGKLLAESSKPISGIVAEQKSGQNDKVVTVIGYPIKIRNQQNINSDSQNPVNIKRDVTLKFVQGIKFPKQDGSETPKITYYVNGVKTPADEASVIKSENIKEISVIKKEDRSGEIYLKLKEEE